MVNGGLRPGVDTRPLIQTKTFYMPEILEKKPDAISEGLSKVYDLAIDHAIETARQHYVSGREDQPINVTIDSIVIKLKSLKK